MSAEQPSPEQARWDALVDREAIGEAPTADELQFIARFEAEHPELARERAVFADAIASLREQLDQHEHDVDELGLAREAAAALERYRTEREPAASPRRRWWLAGVAAAAVVIGLASLIGLGSRAPEPTPTPIAQQQDPPPAQQPREPVDPRPIPAAPVDPVGRLSMIAGVDPHAELGQPFAPGDGVARLLGPDAQVERACVSWSDPIAVVCFEGQLSAAADPALGERRLRLESGRLVAALAPLGPGQRFSVETMAGTVSAVGTVFAVEVYEGRTWVTVLEGRVELRDPTVRALAAGQRTSLRGEVPGDEPSPLAADAIPTALAELVELAELLRASPGDARLRVPELSEQRVRLRVDGRELAGPAELALAAGVHDQELLDGDGELVASRALELRSGQVVALDRELAQLGAAAQPGARKPPSAKQLAEAAQRHRMARDYAETARLYRELLDRYPDSPEAANVPVRLGDLLSSTGDHQAALEAYERYLERGAKQLAPEAEFGRIRALRALGRTVDERAAIEAFVQARPDDYRSAELKERLAEL